MTENRNDNENVKFNVTLTKDPYKGLGIIVSGGKDMDNEDVVVRQFSMMLLLSSISNCLF